MGILNNFRKSVAGLIYKGDNDFFYTEDGKVYYRNRLIQSAHEFNYKNQWEAYQKNPILFIIVNKKIEYCTKVKFYIQRGENQITDDPLLDILNSPNYFQNRNEYIAEWVVNQALAGKTYVWRMMMANKVYNFVVLREDGLREKPLTPEQYQQALIDRELTGGVEYWVNGAKIELNYDEIFAFYENVTDKNIMGIGTSKVLKDPIDNNRLRLEADNTMTSYPGGRGFIYSDHNDADSGNVKLSDKEKQAIEERLHTVYGATKDKMQIGVSEKKLGMLQLRQNIKDFLIGEGTYRDFEYLIGAYKMPREIFPFAKGATYENQKSAELKYLQGDALVTMQNFADGHYKMYYPEGNDRLVATYEHLPIFYEVRKDKAKTLNTLSQAIEKLLKNNIIDEAEAKEMIKHETQ